MADGRRRRWIAWDTEFNAGLGADIREHFGGIGCWVFNSFIVACKKNATQGRMSYTNEAEALMAMGIPGMPLIDEHGQPWELDTLWAFLARRRIVRREKRGRVVTIVASKWEHWQNPSRKVTSGHPEVTGERHESEGAQHAADGKVRVADRKVSTADTTSDEQTRRSEAQNTKLLDAAKSPDINPDVDLHPDPESEINNDPDVDTLAGARTVLDDAIDLSRQQEQKRISLTGDEDQQLRGLIDRLEAMCTGENRRTVRNEAVTIVAQCLATNVSVSVLESAITDLSKSPPALPRALIPVIARHCQKRGLPAPMLSLSIVKSA